MLRQTRYDGEHVGMMITATDVYVALDSPYARSRPAYVKAVLTSYVQIKLARGKTKLEASHKLEAIERQREFYAVRAELSLPRSRVFPAPPPPAPASPASTSQRRASQRPDTGTHPFTRRVTVSGAGAARTSGADAQAVAASAAAAPPRNPEDTDEPPPPPYASQDPDPGSTRLLQERLAAEAEANGQSPMSLVSPVAPSTAPPPIDAEVFAPPPGPPPGAQRRSSPPRASTPPHTAPAASGSGRGSTPARSGAGSGTGTSDAPAEPATAEEREALEQSLLDEALRASVASERERAEYERAVQLSLAEAEREQQRAQSVAGPSRPGEGAGARAAGQPARATHRRTVSDMPASRGGYEVTGVDQHVVDLLGGIDLSDNEDEYDARAPRAQVAMPVPQPYLLHPGAATPERTAQPAGPRYSPKTWQSNNPFLSPEEQDDGHAESSAGAGPSYPAGQAHPDLLGVDLLGDEPSESAPERGLQPSPSRQDARDGPGSGYTLASYHVGEGESAAPRLPPKPQSEYAAPTGPPPGWSAAASQAGAPPPLPARPRSMVGAPAE